MPVKYTDLLKQRVVELVIHAQADPATAHKSNCPVHRHIS